VKIVAGEEPLDYVRERGGRLWVWIDPHQGVGGGYTYLVASTSPPGATKQTRMRSSRRATWFKTTREHGIEVLLYPGSFQPPAELHLEMKGRKRDHIKAYWNGCVFVGDDIPPPEDESATAESRPAS
jgi:hypothetical protein